MQGLILKSFIYNVLIRNMRVAKVSHYLHNMLLMRHFCYNHLYVDTVLGQTLLVINAIVFHFSIQSTA